MFLRRKYLISTASSVSARAKHSKDHWSMKDKKIFPKHRALEHFDDFYKSVFGDKWPSIRVALLSPQKYVALVNNFGDTEKTCEKLENLGGINLRTLYNIQKEKFLMKKQKKQRDKQLDKIYKMDQSLENFLMKQRQDEVSSVYGTNANEISSIPESINNTKEPTTDISSASNTEDSISTNDEGSSLSLHARLKHAKYDERRLINPEVGLAALHEFIPATKLKGIEDWVFESEHYQYYQNPSEFPIKVEAEAPFTIPETFNVYSYERGNISDFPSPKRGSTGVFSHYLMNGGSILPVLALDLQAGDRVLDACAAPGGKSLLMLQTLLPGLVISNDIQESRINRLKSVFDQYLYDYGTKWKGLSYITKQDARALMEYDSYDKVLVDVPCTTDRHSVNNDDNNIFKPTRIKERLRIPELQSQILSNCLRLVKPGGTVVYSTCSLSPVQNDGVVHLALRQAFENHNIEACIRNISSAMVPFDHIFQFGYNMGLRYGQMVIPFLPSNFGPLYFSKIIRLK
ncbi:5-methylcytosine rRNA methyltransferase NSUN4-like [Ctenocephalides felis]|uniref:5-methylcytosine rRNA methyltransferase NSUN4-like n=1 Tax=Ctenocephalides felis TaxID=7515 RepID=UPI000E6E46E2|nr:5-methylcytosine rRNA methyltransferase NSUN4-like [Ctenocephalides felis]XP_026476434.1 5-methylcytosine rRNA methyltransferase NSUN4-like [Ctenocephalides felis]